MTSSNETEQLPAVLMVDDNPVNLYALKAALDLPGVELMRAGSGAEALRMVLQRDFAVILMDVQMPGMDGFETATLIRQRQRSSRTPIIFVTAHAPDVVKQLAGYAAGAVDYLFKPVDPTILRSKVQVFVELYRHTELKLKAAAMEAANRQLESDLDTQAKLADQLAHLTQHDLLTGLPSRVAMEHFLKDALATARPAGHGVALVLIQLDGFRGVIDSLGHAAGDAVLQEAAQRLRKLVRADQLAAFVSGSEFVLVLPGLNDAADAVGSASDVVTAFAAPFAVGGEFAALSASVGIAAAPDDGQDVAALLKAADIARSQVQLEGGNGWRFCTAELAERSLRRARIDRGLRRALDQAEFQVHYQPRVTLPEGRLCGFEALLRWQSTELGAIGPAEFIPLTEASGQIVAIGEWVLRQACAQARSWRDAGLGCESMAVNVSPRQLQDESIVAVVHDALAESGLSAGGLELEVTESMSVFEDVPAMDRLRRIQAMGVRIAIDDFGTGFSSLSFLKSFPFDRIKVHQSFMRDVTSDAASRAILSAVLAMSRDLGVTVVAEGVETDEQLAYLRSHLLNGGAGACQVQGFLYSRPLDAISCTALLEAQQQG